MTKRNPRRDSARKNAVLAAALNYAKRGWQVLSLHGVDDTGDCRCGDPDCRSAGKHPSTRRGLHDAAKDHETIRGWFQDNPRANIGIRTGIESGLVVLDVDPRNGGDDSLTMLEDKHGKLPNTVKAKTGGGGQHLFFRHPGGSAKCRSNFEPGLDIKADGGYVVAPPSRHVSGNRYRWDEGCSPDEVEIAELPNWLLEQFRAKKSSPTKKRLKRKTAKKVSLSPAEEACLKALLTISIEDKCDGSKRLFTAACRCVEFDLDDDAALRVINTYLDQQPAPTDWSDDDILKRIRDAEQSVERGSRRAASNTVVDGGHEYAETDHGLVRRRLIDGEVIEQPLANFCAKILEEVTRDDGVDLSKEFVIEAQVGGQTLQATVPAALFAKLDWVAEQLGARAIIEAGYGIRDRVRCAIQYLSGEIKRRVVYAHTGWREIDGRHVYLSAGASIDATGVVEDVVVELPGALGKFRLPAPPKGEELMAATKAAMQVLDAAPDRVTIPVWLAIWRAVLEASDFCVFLVGQTGAGKSEIAALAQQFFGAELDARNLPANWASTANSLEVVAFTAKDALLVIDDFAPQGTVHEVGRLHREAERLLRAQGNSAGRGRLRRDASLREAKPPRGLVLSTGEDVPRGQSIRARCLVVDVPTGTLGNNSSRFTACQIDAANGMYAAAMAGFLQFVARHREAILCGRREFVSKWRERVSQAVGHGRTASIIAELLFAAYVWSKFAVAIKVFDEPERVAFFNRCRDVLLRQAKAQHQHLRSADPVDSFFEFLSSAIASGKAHVTTLDGKPPENHRNWGWRNRDDERRSKVPMGDRVGWVDGPELYLDWSAAYAAAEKVAKATNESLGYQPATLAKRLSERRLLKSRGKSRLQARKTICGSRQYVLHVDASLVVASSTSKRRGTHASRRRSSPNAAQFSSPISPRKKKSESGKRAKKPR